MHVYQVRIVCNHHADIDEVRLPSSLHTTLHGACAHAMQYWHTVCQDLLHPYRPLHFEQHTTPDLGLVHIARTHVLEFWVYRTEVKS